MALRHIKEIYAPLSELKFGRRILKSETHDLVYAIEAEGIFEFLDEEGYLCDKDKNRQTPEVRKLPKMEEANKVLNLKKRQFALCVKDFELPNDVLEITDTTAPEAYLGTKDLPVILVYRDDAGEDGNFITQESAGEFVKWISGGHLSIKGGLKVGYDVTTGFTDGIVDVKDSITIDGQVFVNATRVITATSLSMVTAGTVIDDNGKITAGAIEGSSVTLPNSSSPTISLQSTTGKIGGRELEIKNTSNAKQAEITTTGEVTGSSFSVMPGGTTNSVINASKEFIGSAVKMVEGQVTVSKSEHHVKLADGDIQANRFLINDTDINTIFIKSDAGNLPSTLSLDSIRLMNRDAANIPEYIKGAMFVEDLYLQGPTKADFKKLNYLSEFTAREATAPAFFRDVSLGNDPAYPQWSVNGIDDSSSHILDFTYQSDESTSDPILQLKSNSIDCSKDLIVNNLEGTEESHNLSVSTNTLELDDAQGGTERHKWYIESDQGTDFVDLRDKVISLVKEVHSVAKGFKDLVASKTITPITYNDSGSTATLVPSNWGVLAELLSSESAIILPVAVTNPYNTNNEANKTGALYDAMNATTVFDFNNTESYGDYVTLASAFNESKDVINIILGVCNDDLFPSDVDIVDVVSKATSLQSVLESWDLDDADSILAPAKHNILSISQKESSGNEARVATFSLDENKQKELSILGETSEYTGVVNTNRISLEDSSDVKVNQRTKWSLESIQKMGLELQRAKVVNVILNATKIASKLSGVIEKSGNSSVDIEFPQGGKKSATDWINICIGLLGKENEDNPTVSDDDNDITGALYDALLANSVGLITDAYNDAPNKQTLCGALNETVNALTLISAVASALQDFNKDTTNYTVVSGGIWGQIVSEASTLSDGITTANGLLNEITTAIDIDKPLDEVNCFEVKTGLVSVAKFTKHNANESNGVLGKLSIDEVASQIIDVVALDARELSSANIETFNLESDFIKVSNEISFSDQTQTGKSCSIFVDNGVLMYRDNTGIIKPLFDPASA